MLSQLIKSNGLISLETVNNCKGLGPQDKILKGEIAGLLSKARICPSFFYEEILLLSQLKVNFIPNKNRGTATLEEKPMSIIFISIILTNNN